MIVYLGDVYYRELEPSTYSVRATITQVSNSNQPSMSNTEVGIKSALGVVLRGVRYLGSRAAKEVEELVDVLPRSPSDIIPSGKRLRDKLADADSTNY